ncbi:MAG: hypothetical protein LM573_08610, partial [Thermofilum sp.]|nr:hypothetical protein [Thermofilum sp.]
TTLTALLILLATLSFAAATVTLTNITEWHVYAKTPPIVKVDGDVFGYGYGKYVNVTTTPGNDGTNRTVISVLGFTGDPVKYDNVLYICNKDYQGYTYNVKLVAKKVLSGNWDYVQYLSLWLYNQGPLTIQNGQTTGETQSVPVSPGSCVPVSVEVLVKPNAPTGSELIAVEVDVVSSTG